MNISRILVLLSLIAFSCNSKQKVTITSVDFDSSLLANQVLTYEFSESIVDSSETGFWNQNKGIFLFEPEVEGEYRWTSTSKISFRPTTSYAASQEYTILLNEIYLDEIGATLQNQAAKSVAGPAPFIKNLSATWQNKSTNGSRSTIALDMEFNYQIIPNEIKDKLEFLLNEEPLEIVATSVSVTKTLSLNLPVNTRKGPITVDMALLPGIKDASGSINYTERLDLGTMSFQNLNEQPTKSVSRIRQQRVKTSEDEESITKVITKEATEEEIKNLEVIDDQLASTDQVQKEQILFYKANTLQKMGKIREAIIVWTELLELETASADYYNNRGVCYNSTAEYDKAIEDLSKAIEIDPLSISAYINRGYAFSEMERYDEAMKDYYTALQYDASHPFAHNNLAYVLLKENRLEEAKKHLDDSKKADSYNSWLFRNYAYYYALKKDKKNLIENIKTSINLGYQDKEWFEKEAAFEFVKNDKEFTDVIK